MLALAVEMWGEPGAGNVAARRPDIIRLLSEAAVLELHLRAVIQAEEGSQRDPTAADAAAAFWRRWSREAGVPDRSGPVTPWQLREFARADVDAESWFGVLPVPRGADARQQAQARYPGIWLGEPDDLDVAYQMLGTGHPLAGLVNAGVRSLARLLGQSAGRFTELWLQEIVLALGLPPGTWEGGERVPGILHLLRLMRLVTDTLGQDIRLRDIDTAWEVLRHFRDLESSIREAEDRGILANPVGPGDVERWWRASEGQPDHVRPTAAQLRELARLVFVVRQIGFVGTGEHDAVTAADFPAIRGDSAWPALAAMLARPPAPLSAVQTARAISVLLEVAQRDSSGSAAAVALLASAYRTGVLEQVLALLSAREREVLAPQVLSGSWLPSWLAQRHAREGAQQAVLTLLATAGSWETSGPAQAAIVQLRRADQARHPAGSAFPAGRRGACCAAAGPGQPGARAGGDARRGPGSR